jgi:LmbE family N-acetylglucosaminyl deacetylase
MENTPLRLLILGAHPDDAEFHAGGLASIYAALGHIVRMVSLTNGQAGHFQRPPRELAALRRSEAVAAGRVIGAPYVTWDIPDGELVADVSTRYEVIREIRTFRPDLVLTHRPCDYHPDHRAAGQLVMDASYLVTVPNLLPEVPPLMKDPVVAYMVDTFTKPIRLQPHMILDVEAQVDSIVRMLACHRSQVFEWLPYHDGILDKVPSDNEARLGWLRDWYRQHAAARADHFRQELIAAFGVEWGSAAEFCEFYEISEYAGQADRQRRQQLFPGAHCLGLREKQLPG